jgi:acyl carrier protein
MPKEAVASAIPTREYVHEVLSRLLQEICHRAPEEILDSATIDRELEMESVQMIELQVAVEQEFDVTIDFLEVLRLNSFRRITDYIHALALEQMGVA